MGLGSVSISDQTIDFIRSILPAGSTILEFGSGAGTIALSEYYTMYSVDILYVLRILIAEQNHMMQSLRPLI